MRKTVKSVLGLLWRLKKLLHFSSYSSIWQTVNPQNMLVATVLIISSITTITTTTVPRTINLPLIRVWHWFRNTTATWKKQHRHGHPHRLKKWKGTDFRSDLWCLLKPFWEKLKRYQYTNNTQLISKRNLCGLDKLTSKEITNSLPQLIIYQTLPRLTEFFPGVTSV